MTFMKIQFYDMVANKMGIEGELYDYVEVLYDNGLISKEDRDLFYDKVNFEYTDTNDLKLTDEGFIEKNFSKELKNLFDKCVSTKDFAMTYLK